MDNVELYQLNQQTRQHVARLHRAVERGECVTEAINFCRFIVNSGVLAQLKRATPGDPFLPIDGALTEWEVSECLQLALSVPNTRRLGPFEQRVLENLDLIAAQISKFSVPVGVGPSTAGVSPQTETTTGTKSASGRQPEVTSSKLP